MSGVLLEFCGPYRCTQETTGCTSAFDFYGESPKAADCGIYLQAVLLARTLRVAYVGRATCFTQRLPGAFRNWLSGKDRRSGWALELDAVKYCEGIRTYDVVPTGREDILRLRRTVLDCTVVVLASLPMGTPRDEQERIEGAIMRHLKRCPPPIADFLYNEPVGDRRFFGTIAVRPPQNILIEGLSSPFADV